MSIITLENDLKARGFIAQASLNAASVLQPGEVVYAGFDPTADSLHVGNLVTIMGLARMQRARMTPIALVGGATGLIGDPSGRSSDRPLLSRDNVQTNAMSIKEQLRNFIDFSGPFAGKMTNNIDWFGTMDLITYLRDIAGKLRANQLLNKDAVRTRLESEDGNSKVAAVINGVIWSQVLRLLGSWRVHSCMQLRTRCLRQPLE